MHRHDDSSETTPLQAGAPASTPQVVRTFDAGIGDSNDYGAFTGFSATAHAKKSDAQDTSILAPEGRRRRVIVVGAGVCGVQQASILLNDGRVQLHELQIFDALDDFGGVWRKNTYPGCACDVPAMIYTTSYHIWRKFTHFFATAPQIQEYYSDFAHKYSLQNCTQFNSFVRSCIWDEEYMVWQVAVQKRTGELEWWMADAVIQCVGSLDRPKWGNTPGRETYQGVAWHTAHWNHDYDLTGKNIAIIGCGPSAAQMLPEIIAKVEHCTVYMRTPPLCVARNDFAYSPWFRFAIVHVPFFAWCIRMRMNLRMMMMGRAMATDGTPENDMMTQLAVKYMESQIQDSELRELVRPHSKYYCKRPLRLDHFYSSLARPNCTVLRDNLVRYTAAGVVSADKTNGKEEERKFDAIIFGTGFNVAQFLEHEKVIGLGGIDLQKKWKEHPEALYGLATNQFPNFFMNFGPNSAHVWSSQQDSWERQARLVSKAVAEIVKKEAKGIKFAMHPNLARERQYNKQVQDGQRGRFVWARNDCITYYKNDDGWNTYTMPWTWWEFRCMLRKIFWKEWDTIEKPLTEVRMMCD